MGSKAILCFLIVIMSGCGSDSEAPSNDQPQTYAVRGVVSGLVGTLNFTVQAGNESTLFTISPSNNGFFEFPLIEPGNTYSVQITSTSSANEVCLVENGEGIVQANVDNILITCTSTVEPATCDSNRLDLCTSLDACLMAEGNWYNDICNSATEPLTCELAHLDLCNSESACSAAGGHWYGEICYSKDSKYTFDETEAAIAHNTSFNELHGEIVGASQVAGKVNNALYFGANLPSFVSIKVMPNNMNDDFILDFPDNKLTIEAWYKFETLNSDEDYYIFGGTSWGLNSFDLVLEDSQFTLYFFFNGQSEDSTEIIKSDYSFETDRWYHISIVYTGSEGIIYIDGTLNESSPIIHPVSRVYNTLTIGGARSFSGVNSFPGSIDEFTFTSGERTSEEIHKYLDALDQ